jgi:hypothetical protein
MALENFSILTPLILGIQRHNAFRNSLLYPKEHEKNKA